MRQLSSFFDNPFLRLVQEVGVEKFRKFFEKHIQLTTAKNGGGEYTQIITDSNAKYSQFYDSYLLEDTSSSIQQGLTITVDNIIEEFKSSVKQQEGLIRSKFNVGTPEYEEFFPNGITEYTGSKKEDVQTLMERVVNRGTAHVLELGQPFVDLFTDILNRYTAGRTAQLQKIGETKDLDTQTDQFQIDGADQLFHNLLFIADNFRNQPEIVTDFFDESFISSGGGEEKEIYTGTVAENVTHTIVEDVFSDDPEIVLSNTGTTDLMFCLAPTAETACTAGITIAPDESQTVNASELGDISYTFLNVTNLSSDIEGEYSVSI